jgi:hypothetical protein
MAAAALMSTPMAKNRPVPLSDVNVTVAAPAA